MTYLRVRNFWDYQNADIWKKAQGNKGGHRHPPWCKLQTLSPTEVRSPLTPPPPACARER